MKRELKERIEKYVQASEPPYAVYFSDKAPDTRYKTEKYFFKYHNTHGVSACFSTQKEIESFLTERGF